MIPQLLSAVPTPFNNEKKIELDQFTNMVYNLISKGSGVVVFGTTGESPTISDQEFKFVLLQLFNDPRYDSEQFVVGIGGNNTQEVIEKLHYCENLGYKYFMLTTPYYNKPTQFGLIMHFKTIIKSKLKDSKFILYNVPGRTNVNLLPETVQKIYNSTPEVIAIKEASGNLGQMIKIRELCPHLMLYCGDDGLIVPAMSIGAVGLISVIGNVYPTQFNTIINLCKQNMYKEAFDLYSKFNRMIELLFTETSPSPLKYVMFHLNLLTTDKVRLPLVEVQSSQLKDDLFHEINVVRPY
jgi:4-hydroxy-tetrahydrodipicolinate synthase